MHSLGLPLRLLPRFIILDQSPTLVGTVEDPALDPTPVAKDGTTPVRAATRGDAVGPAVLHVLRAKGAFRCQLLVASTTGTPHVLIVPETRKPNGVAPLPASAVLSEEEYALGTAE